MAFTIDITDVRGLSDILNTTIDIPKASSSILGGVKIGSGINVATDGTISVSSSGNGSSFPINFSLPANQWLITITPTNYGKIYSNNTTQGKYTMGGYKDNVGTVTNPINFSTKDREDKVFTIAAYNTLFPNGSRQFSNEASWDESVETHFDNSGSLPYGDFEWHQRVNTTDGHELRNSWYVNKTNGMSRRDWSANQHQFYYPVPGGNFLYASLGEGSLNTFSKQAGRILGFWATDYDGTQVGIKELGGVGTIKVPGVFDIDGYTGIYQNDADARTNGHLVTGKNYWVIINGIKVLAQVQ